MPAAAAHDQRLLEVLKAVAGGFLLSPDQRALEQIRREDSLIDHRHDPSDEPILFARRGVQNSLDLLGIERRRGQRRAAQAMVNATDTTSKPADFRNIA